MHDLQRMLHKSMLPRVDKSLHYPVLSRIQGFLSPQQNGSPLQKEPDRCPAHDHSPEQDQKWNAKFLKIRIVTWNMHDSLPKGVLEDLLGKIPLYDASSAKPGQFPCLGNDTSHPFHLVVVAGQECPTLSGIPMGLGAGFKISEKDREKLKSWIHDDKTDAETSEKERHEEVRDIINTNEKAALGWTQLVEDWLCNGIGYMAVSSSSGTSEPFVRQKEPRKGPYQLLIKDRLMGIYLALYIHRDLMPLVQGISKSSVATGLIGGRIGNKGGVGISLQLDGTTFLFLNAHLAAHEGKVNHRLANLSKIKTELEVDTFLASDDIRTMAEDITDKFDFTFLFGDLNFRLDMSRLHADWLISRQEYVQALEFDELKAIMTKGAFFDGFREAPITFPPTFKYDVSRHSKRRKCLPPEDQQPLPQAEQRQSEIIDDDVDEATDLVSLASSVITINSTVLSESELADDYFHVIPSNSTIPSNGKKLKGKPKWLSLLSPSFVTSPKFSMLQPFEPLRTGSLTPTTPNTAFSVSPQPTTMSIPPKSVKKLFLRPSPMILSNFSLTQSNEIVEEEKGVYDTSSKKRVPSWCDRILWKTTIPKSHVSVEQSDDFSPQSRRTIRRVSQFFQTLRSPSSRTSSLETNGHWAGGTFSEQIPIGRRSSPTTPDVNRPKPTPIIHDFKLDGLAGSRRANSAFSPPPTAPLPSQVSSRRLTMGSTDQPRSASGSIWRFLPSFLSPSSNTSPEERQSPSFPAYVKGDIVCLGYGTLDDKEMRKLEGRSDHRPVIGAYAAYF